MLISGSRTLLLIEVSPARGDMVTYFSRSMKEWKNERVLCVKLVNGIQF